MAAAIFLGSVVYMANLHGVYAERRAQAAHQHSERAQEAARRACLNAGPGVVECVYETIKASEESERGEQDLTAQQDVALWTLGTMTLGLIAIAISGAGLIALIRTVSQGRESLEHAHRTSQAQLRPYLFIDKFDIESTWLAEGEYPLEGLYNVTIWFKNFGITPARNIRCLSMCYLADNLADVRPQDLTRGFTEAGVAAPGHHRRTFDMFQLNADDAQLIEFGGVYVILRIVYLYTDGAEGEFEEAFDYWTHGEGIRKSLFYILSDRVRENARIALEQRSLFEEAEVDFLPARPTQRRRAPSRPRKTRGKKAKKDGSGKGEA